jgi:hypothetical protein
VPHVGGHHPWPDEIGGGRLGRSARRIDRNRRRTRGIDARLIPHGELDRSEAVRTTAADRDRAARRDTLSLDGSFRFGPLLAAPTLTGM